MKGRLKIFNQAVQDAGEWINEICKEMGDPRKQIAYHALRGVLSSLRDRLPHGEVAQLAAQLPLIIRGIYYEGYQPAGKPEKFCRDEFIRRVSAHLQMGGGADPVKATRGVLTVLTNRVSAGEIGDVRECLPKDLRSLWPEVDVAVPASAPSPVEQLSGAEQRSSTKQSSRADVPSGTGQLPAAHGLILDGTTNNVVVGDYHGHQSEYKRDAHPLARRAGDVRKDEGQRSARTTQ